MKTKNELIVENWNLRHGMGTNVRYWTGARVGEPKIGVAYTEALLLSGHTPVVYIRAIEGKNMGAVALSHVEAIA